MSRNETLRQHEKQALAASLRFLRIKYNVKRQWLADTAGLSLYTYEKIEQGITQAQFTDVVALCRASGAPMEELMQHYQRELDKLQAGDNSVADSKRSTL